MSAHNSGTAPASVKPHSRPFEDVAHEEEIGDWNPTIHLHGAVPEMTCMDARKHVHLQYWHGTFASDLAIQRHRIARLTASCTLHAVQAEVAKNILATQSTINQFAAAFEPPPGLFDPLQHWASLMTEKLYEKLVAKEALEATRPREGQGAAEGERERFP